MYYTAGSSNSLERLTIVEIVCAEHLERTILMCDEATLFQQIVSLAVAERGGKWSFAQYDPIWRRVERCGGIPCPASRDYFVGTSRTNDTEDIKDARRVLERRAEFMRNEGRLIRRMEASARSIRQAGSALHTVGKPLAPI